MNCRGCGSALSSDHFLCNLGNLPLANGLLNKDQLGHADIRWPHKPLICRECLLVQMPEIRTEIFNEEYPFFSGASSGWIAHCRQFADSIASEYKLGPTSRVLEIGSNDGTMLRRFRRLGIPAIGVEPCKSVAQHAIMEGLPTVVGFWGADIAKDLASTMGVPSGKSWKADFVIANNVLAHVPDLKDFLQGAREILVPGGTASFEVAYLGDLIQKAQFDQIYAEHYSYFSVSSLCGALIESGLWPSDVEYLPNIHGGSIRVYATHLVDDYTLPMSINNALETESKSQWHNIQALQEFASCPPRIKRKAWMVLTDQMRSRPIKPRIVGYGASAKATIMLNYFGMGPEVIEFIADITPAKWGKYIPGVQIPIVTPQQLKDAEPDVVVNFAWNWRKESERRIKEACLNAKIIYLHHATTPELKLVA